MGEGRSELLKRFSGGSGSGSFGFSGGRARRSATLRSSLLDSHSWLDVLQQRSSSNDQSLQIRPQKSVDE